MADEDRLEDTRCRTLITVLQRLKSATIDEAWRPGFVLPGMENPLQYALWLGQRHFDRGFEDQGFGYDAQHALDAELREVCLSAVDTHNAALGDAPLIDIEDVE